MRSPALPSILAIALALALALTLTLTLVACSGPSDESKPKPESYARGDWAHWIDEDGDCQDTRVEILVAEATRSPKFGDGKRCKVTSGEWRCPYTGELITDPALLDVDHVVPLGNAYRSGGQSWDRERRRSFANDLAHPEHLVAVDRRANRAKGDRGPEEWLPPNPGYRCTYVRDWVAIKSRWALTMTPAEQQAVATQLAACDAGKLPPLPQDEPACCRICRSGKACGNSCIGAGQTCNKAPGCACNG